MAVLEMGAKAPSFSLLSDSGESVALKDFKGKTVVLFFYPKDLTTGCTQEACDFRDHLGRIKKKGAVVLGISRDAVKTHVKFRDKHELNFPLLADEEGEVCDAYGVWVQKSMYGRKYMGIERTTFVIGPTGKIEHVFSKVKVKGHVEEVLAVL